MTLKEVANNIKMVAELLTAVFDMCVAAAKLFVLIVSGLLLWEIWQLVSGVYSGAVGAISGGAEAAKDVISEGVETTRDATSNAVGWIKEQLIALEDRFNDEDE